MALTRTTVDSPPTATPGSPWRATRQITVDGNWVMVERLGLIGCMDAPTSVNVPYRLALMIKMT